MHTNLENSIVERASHATVILVAVVDAIAPVLAGALVLSPFTLVLWGIIDVNTAFIGSVGVDLGFLFVLGTLLGRSAKSNMFLYGTIMVSIGFLIALFFILLRISVV
jgi:predicted membrane protein (TIGR00267 family)